MQSTPTKKQATTHNAILTTTPQRRAGDERGQMAAFTPEDLKAQLASRPRSVRSSVSQGYAVSPRAALTSHRSEPSIMPGHSLPSSPSPSPSRPLMAMCETFTSPNQSSPSSNASLSYYNSTQSILERANQSYLSNWSPSMRSSISSNGPSPRKRGQMDEEEDDNNLGLVGAKAYNDNMDEDETMMVEDLDDNDLPLSKSSSSRQIPPLSFSNSGSTSSSASSSATSSDMFFSPFPSPSTQQHQQQGRQLKTIPRRALGKTQSLPADAFMENMGIHTQPLVRDVFNSTEGF